MVWSWIKGDIRIYTKKLDLVKKAIGEGYCIKTIEEKPHIISY